ncbi:MAG TPA: mechanosensitive ion channel family protein [Vicinamibacterales bacterium]|nr:mechanosensitive ion channel family protein [Vicinamibacterales bacterium]
MSHWSHIVAGAAVLLLVLVLRAISLNTFVRRRLALSGFLSSLYIAGNLFLAFVPVAADADARIRSWEQLALTLAILNAVVVVAINPLRADRLPDRFPGIMQDTILVGLFLVIATFMFQERVATASAVGAVVIGFALQDTLGNAFAGLAIQMEKPFRVGHWINVGAFEGRVAEITWRATKLRTKAGNFVIVPNNVISKEAITNYSEPTAPTRLFVEVGASYLTPPGDVKQAIHEALANCRRVLRSPEPDVVLLDFAASAINYRVRFWADDYERDEGARDEVRTAIYYAFQRHGIEIPWPIQVEYAREEAPQDPPERMVARAHMLERVDIFASLSPQERERLAASARERLYGDGDAIVRQGAQGGSVFIVSAGTAVVSVDPGGEVARLAEGNYFGEMSLLTGEPRSATVSARGQCRVFEVDASMFREIAAADPAVLEKVGAAAMARRAELHAVRDSAAAAVAPESPSSLLLRMKRFLRL